MTLDRRAFIGASAAAAALPRQLRANSGPVLHPEDFGARGDGSSDDSRAFAALSAEVNRRGGGTISLAAGRTYSVGAQTPGGGLGWSPGPVLQFNDLQGPLTIIGNGARLRCRPGLRFGTFDPATDKPVQRHMPNYRGSELASPYRGLIGASGCRGPITIRHVELDGNLQHLRIGGAYGDTGWQVPATGLLLEHNLADEWIENVYTHHHGQDGAMFIGDPQRAGRTRISHLVSRYNGRQGLSITGGRGYDVVDCEFSHSGRSAIYSAPGAGMDIEAEGKPIRDLTFTRCKFIDNRGVGMLADSGDSEGARFTDCLFVGTTAWSAWPYKPGFSFQDCTFVGSVVHPFPDAHNPARACRFVACHFTDDPKLSPTGKVFLGQGFTIVNMADSRNVMFDRCTFDLIVEGVLPWGWNAIYRDCTMKQTSKQTAETKGRYLGRTTISGPVDLYGSMVEGDLFVNGKLIPKGPKGVARW